MKGFATRAHARVYRLSGGRILGHMGGQPVLLLNTIGRRTGRTHTSILQFLPRDGAFVVVAANRGAPRPPSWYLNLCADPKALVRIGAEDVDVLAREVRDSESAGLWRELTVANPYLARVACKAGHPLPGAGAGSYQGAHAQAERLGPARRRRARGQRPAPARRAGLPRPIS